MKSPSVKAKPKGSKKSVKAVKQKERDDPYEFIDAYQNNVRAVTVKTDRIEGTKLEDKFLDAQICWAVTNNMVHLLAKNPKKYTRKTGSNSVVLKFIEKELKANKLVIVTQDESTSWDHHFALIGYGNDVLSIEHLQDQCNFSQTSSIDEFIENYKDVINGQVEDFFYQRVSRKKISAVSYDRKVMNADTVLKYIGKEPQTMTTQTTTTQPMGVQRELLFEEFMRLVEEFIGEDPYLEEDAYRIIFSNPTRRNELINTMEAALSKRAPTLRRKVKPLPKIPPKTVQAINATNERNKFIPSTLEESIVEEEIKIPKSQKSEYKKFKDLLLEVDPYTPEYIIKEAFIDPEERKKVSDLATAALDIMNIEKMQYEYDEPSYREDILSQGEKSSISFEPRSRSSKGMSVEEMHTVDTSESSSSSKESKKESKKPMVEFMSPRNTKDDRPKIKKTKDIPRIYVREKGRLVPKENIKIDLTEEGSGFKKRRGLMFR